MGEDRFLLAVGHYPAVDLYPLLMFEAQLVFGGYGFSIKEIGKDKEVKCRRKRYRSSPISSSDDLQPTAAEA